MKTPTQRSRNSQPCKTKCNCSLPISSNKSRKSMSSSKFGQETSDTLKKWTISSLWSTKDNLTKSPVFTWIKYFHKFSWNRIKILKLRSPKNNLKKSTDKFKLPSKRLVNFTTLIKNSELSQLPPLPSQAPISPYLSTVWLPKNPSTSGHFLKKRPLNLLSCTEPVKITFQLQSSIKSATMFLTPCFWWKRSLIR